MKINNIKYFAFAAMLGMSATSCESFLDRPAEDTYNESNFYQNDLQCVQGVNYLYNSPWYDFQRGFIKVGEVLSGNYYMGSSPYLTFTVNGSDEDLKNMSSSLWAVNGHANTVYNRLKSANASEKVKNQCMGECLAWKAMAYFYLVRSFGAVPIIHDNTAELGAGNYNSSKRVQASDVYEYIILTLEKAMELLPAKGDAGRIDKYCAEGLLAKVYLTRSGITGTRSESDLNKAAEYAKDVIDNSGRHLLEKYSDIFRMQNNKNEECLFSWHWNAGRDPWTQQNTLQSDLAMVGFDEFGDCWGGYGGMSVDLQDAFGVNLLASPKERIDVDERRKATMMLPGDVYDYFWTDKGGFNYLKFIYDKDGYGKGGPNGQLQSATGANSVKHLYGDAYDHEQALGTSAANMANGLSTHILRLADIYLIYAEAKMGLATSTTDASAIDAYYAVRSRSVASATRPASITWEDVWKERRLEMAMEGDRWYDYVRLSYYDAQRAITELKSQRRNSYWGLDAVYKEYYTNGTYTVTSSQLYNTQDPIPNVTKSSFTLPLPTEDLVFNPTLMDEPIHVDIRNTYSY
ncbi:RagB/SusD family nutrient uptake outer membrane protein [Phocaeicola paurosaccharolyticus]|uniref:RagB/SusD family nutrient uptake outer membrane protein n=1 Tax=Phocaeicola paurosaccharolyticus TaxID=732242 RepID=UPI00046A159D|nr:RagB/SusD family nutrient uptake outer membrane protein [Phocaeicola paurosaccharolyticus]